MTSTPARATSGTQKQFDQYDAFVAYVIDLCAQSKKAQADLRTGLGRPLERSPYMHRYLVPRFPEPKGPGRYDDARRAHYTVASLIAARPRRARDADEEAAAQAAAEAGTPAATPDGTPVVAETGVQAAGESSPTGKDADGTRWWTRPNLGASLAEAVNRKLIKPDTAEDDLHLLVRQSAETVSTRLPSLTRHILNGGVSVDWSVLLYDLSWWNRDRDRIATRLLESYFRVRTLEDRNARPKENR